MPSLFDATPESLTDLDFYFWRENFPERYKRDLIDGHTAPALGAYLGGMLVRRLGGTWVPRQKPEESQVRVGKRVWLPFLRARWYMQSRQSSASNWKVSMRPRPLRGRRACDGEASDTGRYGSG